MSMEGSALVRRESAATDPCEKEQGTHSETEGLSIPEWSSNVETYKLLQDGYSTCYNAEEQSLVWPPMLLICANASALDKYLDDNFEWLKNTLAKEGVQANNMALTKHVCCERSQSYHLFVLPPSGLSFAAAKAVDSVRRFEVHVFYPSFKGMIDIKNGRVPKFSRQFDDGLKYHGRPRQAWMNLAVDFIRDDGVYVGRGACEKHETMDSVDGKLLGEFHVGVRVLEVLDDLVPSHWEGSLRRWKTTHVSFNGVSLFECLRQHVEENDSDFFCNDESSDSAPFEPLLNLGC